MLKRRRAQLSGELVMEETTVASRLSRTSRLSMNRPPLTMSRKTETKVNSASVIPCLSYTNVYDLADNQPADYRHSRGCVNELQAHRFFPENAHVLRVDQVQTGPQHHGQQAQNPACQPALSCDDNRRADYPQDRKHSY